MVLLEVVYPLIMGIILLFLSPLFLMISTKIFKTADNSYGTAFRVVIWPVIISTVLSIILNYVVIQSKALMIILMIVLWGGLLIFNIWLVASNYYVTVGRAFLILLVGGLMLIIPYVIIALVIGLIIGMISMATQFASLG